MSTKVANCLWFYLLPLTTFNGLTLVVTLLVNFYPYEHKGNYMYMFIYLQDSLIDGYKVPEGSAVIYITYAAHRDPSVFKKPEKFRPERWIDG